MKYTPYLKRPEQALLVNYSLRHQNQISKTRRLRPLRSNLSGLKVKVGQK